MGSIQTKRFSWTRNLTAWESSQRWRQKRAAMREDFQAQSQAALNGFGAAWSNQIDGQANLTAQATLSRIQTATSLAAQAAKGVDITA